MQTLYSVPLTRLSCVAPLAALLAALLAASLRVAVAEDCADLASIYHARYKIALNEEKKLRPVAIDGRRAQLVVWGGAPGAPPAAAAALLHVALRYGLGYDSALLLRVFDVCRANETQMAVAPAAYYTGCESDEHHERIRRLSAGEALVPLRAPLLARAPAADPARSLPFYDATSLSSINLTLLEFKKLQSKLPPCNFYISNCTADGNETQSMRVVLAAAGSPSDEINELHDALCYRYKFSLIFVLFDNTSCFRRTLQYLESAYLSFVFLDEDLWMYKPELFSVRIFPVEASAQCPSRDPNRITELVYRIGDGSVMQTYAPQIANIVQRFCPSLQYMKEILNKQPNDEIGYEKAACKWALENNDTFGSWIANIKHKYVIQCYMCSEDPLNEEYNKIINETKNINTKHDFELLINVELIECYNHRNLHTTFTKNVKNNGTSLVGVVAWSSSEGVKELALDGHLKGVPVMFVGPVPPDWAPELAPCAISGGLIDLAHYYRVFFKSNHWTRLAVLSDETSYAKSFTASLFDGKNFVHVERTVTPGTVTTILNSLRADDARIFIVNTNLSMAIEILQSAGKLDMTPPYYAWIVREWSPRSEHRGVDWGPIFTLSVAWRGASEGVSGAADGSNQTLRARLQALWPTAAWPALAAPLAEVILLLDHSFNKFVDLYSATPYTMRLGRYAMTFSQLCEKTRLPGVEREIKFVNGSIETVIVYLEQWRGTARTVLASWDLRRDRNRELLDATLHSARVPPDRSWCLFPEGGKAFVQKCYDIPLSAGLVVLALLPVVFAVARRARLKRLAVRDLNLVAHMLSSDRLSPVIRGDSLCMLRKIGTGYYGSVYLATLRQSREKAILVAAKELRDESDKAEYLQEAGTLQQLDHENIVKFVGICVSNGSLLILMEYAFYGDLVQYLRSRRHLVGPRGEADGEAAHVSAPALSRLAREAAAALEYLATRGLVHRDVRAANCLIDERRTLKLADFGLARKLHENLEYTSIRRAIFPVLWMAPESLSRGTFSTASDVWSLGVLCLELITLGSRPYGARSPQQVLAYVRLGGHPPLPPDASPQTVTLAEACWQHKAAERVTAGEVVRYLAREPRALRPTLLPAPDIDLAPTDP